MRFEHLSRAEQRYMVEGALPAVLAGIDRPTPTVIIVARVARSLEANPEYVTGLVIGIARDGHPAARQDGETFKRYGKTMKRWTWRPMKALTDMPSPALDVPIMVQEPIQIPYMTMTLEQLDLLIDADEDDKGAWAELVRRQGLLPAAGQAASSEVDSSDW